ncbi:MAG: capsular polysaccharide export protein, LipB/KpsS family [Candidatus Helarchaeota archaeon]
MKILFVLKSMERAKYFDILSRILSKMNIQVEFICDSFETWEYLDKKHYKTSLLSELRIKNAVNRIKPNKSFFSKINLKELYKYEEELRNLSAKKGVRTNIKENIKNNLLTLKKFINSIFLLISKTRKYYFKKILISLLIYLYYRNRDIRVQAIEYVLAYRNYLVENEIECVIVWNGNLLYHKAVTEIAKLNGINTLYMEVGYFPNTVVIDRKGVNFFGEIKDLKLPVYIEEDKLNKFLEKYHNSLEKPAKLINLPKQFIFLPLQVHDDTQILIHSPLIQTMDQLVKLVLEYLPPNYHLIIKEHPKELEHNKIFIKRIKSLIKKCNNVRLYSKINIYQLIKKCSAVVTINSTVGIEALTYYKPVIVLGKAVYGKKGFTCDVSNLDELPSVLKKALSYQPNKEKLNKFLYLLIFHYCIPANYKKPTIKENLKVVDRILGYITN